MSRSIAVFVLLVLTHVSSETFAQSSAQRPLRLEVSGSAGAGRLFRVEDESFGTVWNPGVALEWHVTPRLGVSIEANRLGRAERSDETPSPGPLDATLASATAHWYFGPASSAQPYVAGGLDVLWSRSLNSVTFGSGEARPTLYFEERDRGLGITAGVGVRVPIGRRIVVRPEWRIYDGSLMGGANLSLMRMSIAAGVGW